MTPDQRARDAGIDFAAYTPPANLAPATRAGKIIYTSGHVSQGFQGKLGKDFTMEEGKHAARVCAVQLLQAVYTLTGSLDNVRCIRLLGCVNCTPEFTEAHLVINGASELIWEVLGKDGAGFHARSALGFVSLPVGFAVEVEGIFEVIGAA
jgi:enamine deaminase RidA (YjgF/YER057c/UK114 family)